MFWNLILRYGKNAISWVTDPKNRTIVLFILLCMGSAFIFHQNNKINNLQAQQQTYASNISALTDTVREYRLDNGDLVAEKGALQTSTEELRTINKELYDELQKEKDKPPKTITVVETEVVRDTVYVDDTQGQWLGGDSYQITWAYQDSAEWGKRALEGNTEFNIHDTTIVNPRTQITKDIFHMRIITGFRETNDGHLQIFARTSAPNVNFTSINGAIINPQNYINKETKRWGVGFHIGYGINNRLEAHPFIGVGLNYDIISW